MGITHHTNVSFSRSPSLEIDLQLIKLLLIWRIQFRNFPNAQSFTPLTAPCTEQSDLEASGQIWDRRFIIRLSAHCSNDYCGLIRLWPPIWSQAGEFANKSHHRTLFCSSHQLAFIALQSLAPALALQPRDNLMYIITDTKAKSVVKCCRTLKIRRGYGNHNFEYWIHFPWTVFAGGCSWDANASKIVFHG